MNSGSTSFFHNLIFILADEYEQGLFEVFFVFQAFDIHGLVGVEIPLFPEAFEVGDAIGDFHGITPCKYFLYLMILYAEKNHNALKRTLIEFNYRLKYNE